MPYRRCLVPGVVLGDCCCGKVVFCWVKPDQPGHMRAQEEGLSMTQGGYRHGPRSGACMSGVL